MQPFNYFLALKKSIYKYSKDILLHTDLWWLNKINPQVNPFPLRTAECKNPFNWFKRCPGHVREAVNASSRAGAVVQNLKQAVVHHSSRKLTCTQEISGTINHIQMFHSWPRRLNRWQLDDFKHSWKRPRNRSPFQFGFRLGYGTEIVWVTLVDYFFSEMDRRTETLLILLDLSDRARSTYFLSEGKS